MKEQNHAIVFEPLIQYEKYVYHIVRIVFTPASDRRRKLQWINTTGLWKFIEQI